MVEIITPQIGVPFTFTPDGDVSLVEQGSDEEIQANVWAILSYEPGQFVANPDFGIPQQVFAKGGADLDLIQSIIRKWEPRADEVIERDPNWFQTMIDTITIRRASA